MKKLSVILPVYNAENYLHQCLESIANQTLQDIEIICVDDGSTDSSKEILQQFADSDKRIKIITQKNYGPGHSRNVGVEAAQGEYIAFVDADDYLDITAYEKAYNKAKANNSDIVIFNTECIFESEDYPEKEAKTGYFDVSCYNEKGVLPEVFTHKEIEEFLFYRCWNVWNKIYKTEFIKENKISSLRTIAQDLPFTFEAVLKAERISFINEKLYKYRMENPKSITNNSYKTKKINQIFVVLDKLRKVLESTGKYDEYKTRYWEMFLMLTYCYIEKMSKEKYISSYFRKLKKRFKEIGCPEYSVFHTSIYKAYNKAKKIEQITELRELYLHNHRCTRKMNFFEKLISKFIKKTV